MGIRTNSHLGQLLHPLVIADDHTLHLHSADFRTMVEAAAPSDLGTKDHFYLGDLSTEPPVHSFPVHQPPSGCTPPADDKPPSNVFSPSSEVSMTKGSSSGAFTSILHTVFSVCM
jgi:hypothetical protein